MAGPGDSRRMLRWTLAAAAAVTLLRIAVLMATPLELYPDEAQYWWWAQSPDLGYFSKPPLIAWIIWATTALFGDGEWAIRLAMPLLHAGASLVLYAVAREVFPVRPAVAALSALAYLTLPGVSYSASLASTDAPLLFFWSVALLAFLRMVHGGGWRWALLCGLTVGLGILAKYAMLFFLLGIAVAAAARPRIRKLVAGPHGALVLVIALLVLAPNLVWNLSHQFATVGHIETNADWGRARFSPAHLAGFMAGQFGVFGPLLMAAWLGALWRLRRAAAGPGEIVLAAFSLPILALIALQAFISDANANWAATAYVSAVPLAVAELLERWPRPALWTSFALSGAVLVLLCAVLVWPAAAERLGLGNVFKREEGWRSLARGVDAARARGGYDLVASDNRSVTAELLYYMRPHAAALRIWDADGASHNHFDMTMRLTPPAARVLMVLAPEDVASVAPTFESMRPVATLTTEVGGRHERVMRLFDARNYHGPQARP